MDKKILELEKSLFKYEFISDKNYLNRVIDDSFMEVGKSGKKFDKADVVNELSALEADRKIAIYNYTCDEIAENLYLVHYITKSDEEKIFRSSIWKDENDSIKLLFHQASLYKDDIELVEY